MVKFVPDVHTDTIAHPGDYGLVRVKPGDQTDNIAYPGGKVNREDTLD